MSLSSFLGWTGVHPSISKRQAFLWSASPIQASQKVCSQQPQQMVSGWDSCWSLMRLWRWGENVQQKHGIMRYSSCMWISGGICAFCSAGIVEDSNGDVQQYLLAISVWVLSRMGWDRPKSSTSIRCAKHSPKKILATMGNLIWIYLYYYTIYTVMIQDWGLRHDAQ